MISIVARREHLAPAERSWQLAPPPPPPRKVMKLAARPQLSHSDAPRLGDAQRTKQHKVVVALKRSAASSSAERIRRRLFRVAPPSHLSERLALGALRRLATNN